MTTSGARGVLRDAVLILLLASVTGLLWNRSLLTDVWQGRATGKAATGAAPARDKAVPLPLGLMQVKDFFDRRDALIVDARDASVYAKGHIAGAISLPLAAIGEQLPALRRRVPAAATLVVYCNGFDCHDSKALGEKLLAAGYLQVYVYEGGFPEWQAAGYPVVKGDHER